MASSRGEAEKGSGGAAGGRVVNGAGEVVNGASRAHGRTEPEFEGIELPTLGAEGEGCEECGAPLAMDQRYCLNCGKRRAGPRVDFEGVLAGTGPDAFVPAQGAAAPRRPRDWGSWPAVAGIALLGGMLLIGVLIGNSAHDQSAAPQRIQFVGGAPTSTTGTDTTASTSAPDKNAGAAGKSKPGGAQKSSGPAKPVDTGNAHTLSQSEEQALKNCQGSECNDVANSLGDTIATSGAPAKQDNKQPGGGSSAMVIK